MVAYVGNGTRIQIGLATCASYRFLPGEIKYVDSRDASSLLDALTQDGEPAFVER